MEVCVRKDKDDPNYRLDDEPLQTLLMQGIPKAAIELLTQEGARQRPRFVTRLG